MTFAVSSSSRSPITTAEISRLVRTDSYVAMGDGGSGNDPDHRAQNLSELLGKMLRIDVNVADTPPAGYQIPPGNPLASTAEPHHCLDDRQKVVPPVPSGRHIIRQLTCYINSTMLWK